MQAKNTQELLQTHLHKYYSDTILPQARCRKKAYKCCMNNSQLPQGNCYWDGVQKDLGHCYKSTGNKIKY